MRIWGGPCEEVGTEMSHKLQIPAMCNYVSVKYSYQMYQKLSSQRQAVSETH